MHGPIGSVTVSTDRHRPDTASGLTAGAISFMLTLLETDGHTADLGGEGIGSSNALFGQSVE
jgi:hypothetical protein